MRYIKTFEEINLKYNVGDYVILDVDKIKKDNDDYELKNNFRPKDPIDNIMQIQNFRELGTQYYQVEFYFGYDHDFYLIEDKDILREAAPEEIENFNERRKVYNKMTKFNL